MKTSDSLLDHNYNLYGKETACAVESFFHAAQIPAPLAGEYIKTMDDDDDKAESGQLVFLPGLPVVLRLIVDKKFPNNYHPLILQPLGVRPAGKLRIELEPGLQTLVGRTTPARRLQWALAKDGLNFRDCAGKNCGLLPLYPGEKDRVAVVIDKAAVRKFNNAARYTGDLQTQDVFFGKAKALFKEAWPRGQQEPDLIKFSKFWHHIEELTTQKIVYADWETTDERHRENYGLDCAQSYAERWAGPTLTQAA